MQGSARLSLLFEIASSLMSVCVMDCAIESDIDTFIICVVSVNECLST